MLQHSNLKPLLCEELQISISGCLYLSNDGPWLMISLLCVPELHLVRNLQQLGVKDTLYSYVCKTLIVQFLYPFSSIVCGVAWPVRRHLRHTYPHPFL